MSVALYDCLLVCVLYQMVLFAGDFKIAFRTLKPHIVTSSHITGTAHG